MPVRSPRLFSLAVLAVYALAVSFAHAEAPKGEDDTPILELDDIKIPASYVFKVEKALIAEQKAADAEFELKEPAKFRREIALKQLEWILRERFVKDKKLAVDEKEAEARIDDFRKTLGAEGITYEKFLGGIAKTDEQFRKISSNMLAIEKFAGTLVTDADVAQGLKDFDNRIPYRRCSHILVLYKAGEESQAKRTKEEARKLAEDTLAKLKAGGDFAKLAKENSDDRIANLVDGDLDWVGREGKFAKLFVDALYKLEKVDDLSGVVETEYGFHIIKLTGLKTAEDFKPALRGNLTSEKFDKIVEQLREDNVEKLKWNEKLLGAVEKKPDDAAKTGAPPKEVKSTPVPAPVPEAKTP